MKKMNIKSKLVGVAAVASAFFNGKESHLYYEDNNMWFVEGR